MIDLQRFANTICCISLPWSNIDVCIYFNIDYDASGHVWLRAGPRAGFRPGPGPAQARPWPGPEPDASICQHMQAYATMCQHMLAYAEIPLHVRAYARPRAGPGRAQAGPRLGPGWAQGRTLAYASICKPTRACVSICWHMLEYFCMWEHMLAYVHTC